MNKPPTWGRKAIEQAEIRRTGESVVLDFNPRTFVRRLADGHVILNGSHFASSLAAVEALTYALRRLENAAAKQP